MIEGSEDRLVGQIYDAAFDASLWAPVMTGLAEQLGGEAACMTTLDIFTGEGGGHAALVPDGTMEAYLTHWTQNNPLHAIGDTVSYIRNWRPATIRYEDWVERDALHRSAFFNEFLRPIGAENGIMMGLALVGTSTVTMNIARPYQRDVFSDGEIARAHRWQAHLSRAVRLGHAVQASHAALEAIDQLVATSSQRLFFLDPRGRIRKMSGLAEEMLVTGTELQAANGFLRARQADDDRDLQRLIAQSGVRGGDVAPGGSMKLRRRQGQPYQLSVSPLGPLSYASWSAEPIMLVTVAEGAAPVLPVELRLREQFALTPAETRVAMALMQGGTLREAADAARVSINTVRAQLGVIFAKTGCRRQADLVRLLLSFA